MGCCLGLGIVLSALAVCSAPAESSSVDVQAAQPESVATPSSTILAQFRGMGGVFGGGGRDDDDDEDDHHGPSIGTHSPGGSGHSPGGHGPTIRIPFPTPTHPSYRPTPNYPPYYPRPNYTPRPTYTPRPNYIPVPSTTPVPSNTLPTQPDLPPQPQENVVVVEPELNNFLGDLDFKPITPEQLAAFKDQITKKNDKLGDELKKLLEGNEQAIDQLVDLANQGKLDALALQKFVAALGGKNLALQVQLQASGLLKQLVFNNLAMAALFNVNINLLNININLINININVNVLGGGAWIGFWGFPQWPWGYPVWLGPGMWWGPCAYCPYPYYNPYLTGADVLGIPYSIADPIPDYDGRIITSGILLMNVGGSAVSYSVDGRSFTMGSNYRQLISRRQIVVAFNRGGSFGNARYRIDEGTYKFTPTDRGWELYKHTSKVTLDNTDNPFQFKYVLNNQQQTLPAGYQREHTGKYPLELRFDSGRGEIKRKMMDKGVYKIAVGSDGVLDLFRPDDVTMPAPIAEMAKKADEETKNIFAEPEKIPNLFGDTAADTTPPALPAAPSPDAPALFGPEQT